jgi:predicted Fe-Mo cluster-binding NifX family protein/predicted DNA-binding protein (UPF0251 family)
MQAERTGVLLALANNKDNMPRNPNRKIIRSYPTVRSFIPHGGDFTFGQSNVNLLLEEWEALRLVDYAGMEQTQAALSMGISRQIVQMLVSSARTKLARAVVEGLPLQIVGDQEQNTHTDLRYKERKSKMKIAVTAQHTQVFPHFGRTPEFYLVTAEDGKITEEKIIAAPAEGHGALVGFLVSQGVDTLICGGIGGGAVNSLRSSGIKVYAGASGPVKEQVLSLLSGQLSQQGEANCDHHDEHNHDHQHGQGHGQGPSNGCGHHQE